METYIPDPQEWGEHAQALPTEEDFDPFGGDGDAQYAWRYFGNLTISQAYAKFCEAPENYQEEFMFMGDKAFVYYYPVVERYLHEAVPPQRVHDTEAWILAHCIKAHFDKETIPEVEPLRERVRKLIPYVLENTEKFATSEGDRMEIKSAWKELEGVLKVPWRRNDKAL